MNTLTISNLSKTYSNGVKAIDKISLTITEGMFGLLGPNGAGKSSLMKTIATLQEPDEGSIKFNGSDVIQDKKSIRKNLGYLPQDFGLYPKISAESLLDYLAVLKGITQKKLRRELVEALLHQTNLYDVRKQKLGGYSGGMKQRFGIAQALLSNPKLLLVDEPTAGLDPGERNHFYNILSEISKNTIVILSSHIVDDIQELCTNMGIINKGKLLITGNPLKLIDDLKGRIYNKIISKNKLAFYKTKYKVLSSKMYHGQLSLNIISTTDPGNGFQLVDPSLEDVYFSQF